jgi:hypothetical protein
VVDSKLMFNRGMALTLYIEDSDTIAKATIHPT